MLVVLTQADHRTRIAPRHQPLDHVFFNHLHAIKLQNFLTILALSASPLTTFAAASPKPNIVVILADDFGWGSAGCYGAPADLKTPNLDRLAREGRRFTQAYAPSSLCSPTRYALMTGRYYWRTSIKDGYVLNGDAPLHIEKDRLTLASLCKGLGYCTGAFGKWHLGLQTGVKATDWNQPLAPGPLAVGFDYFYGLAANAWNGPHTFIENEQLQGRIPGQLIAITGNREAATTTGILKPYEVDHLMETLTAKVSDWIEANHEQPFFVYYAPNAVHEPVTPNPKFTGSPYHKYGDFIAELDSSVGAVLHTLDKLKLTENTLVLFTSDNGGLTNPANRDSADAMAAGLAINGPLRGGKSSIWEGGVREPFIIRWPGKVPANTVSDQVICLTDVLATIASILEVPLPAGPHAEDSLDVSRAFFEEKPGPPVRKHVVLQAGDGSYAIRQGNWKLVEHVDAPKIEYGTKQRAKQAEQRKKNAPKHDELFNVTGDVAETTDAYTGRETMAAGMKRLLNNIRNHDATRAGASN